MLDALIAKLQSYLTTYAFYHAPFEMSEPCVRHGTQEFRGTLYIHGDDYIVIAKRVKE